MADLFAEGFGPDVELDRERVGITWAQFAHLYEPFYVYQYATGISGAHALARGVLDGEAGAAERYLEFLRGRRLRSTRSTRCGVAGVDLDLARSRSRRPSRCSHRSSTASRHSHSSLLMSRPNPAVVDLLAPRGDDVCSLLAEGSVYERLRRYPDVPFDPQVGTGALVLDDRYRDVLADVHRGYLAIGVEHGLAMLLQTDTWRATGARIEASVWRGTDLNRANVELVQEVASEGRAAGEIVVVGGLLGPAGDAYVPGEALAR